MSLQHLSLHHFRSYTRKAFDFQKTTIIVGPNAVGKTNLVESIYLLATGKSSRAEKDLHMVQFDKELARVVGTVVNDEHHKLEVILTTGIVTQVKTPLKRYLVNGVPKRRLDFATHLSVVLFSPIDLEMIIGSPGIRRRFLDDVLEQVDRDYAHALLQFIKALRQRNALLSLARETGRRDPKQFLYWDEMLITNASIITHKREEFIDFLRGAVKDISSFQITYDKSILSTERLLQYKDVEIGAGVTLVGPHRDDFFIEQGVGRDMKQFGSRGQQRLVVLQLKLLQMRYMEALLGKRPLLLLDDIFSELDSSHIQLVADTIGKQQTIMTTTHKEFLPAQFTDDFAIIELGKE